MNPTAATVQTSMDGGSRYRRIGPFARSLSNILTAFAILLAINHIFGGLFGFTIIFISYYFLLIALLLPSVFILFRGAKSERHSGVQWYDWGAAALAFTIPLYFAVVGEQIWSAGWEIYAPNRAVILAFVLCILVFEAARRVGGVGFMLIAVFFFAYPTFAELAPGIIKGSQTGFERTVSQHVFGSESLLGIPVRVIGELLIGFIVFAALLIKTGAGTFFLDLAMSVAGHSRGGGAKVAIVASAFFGSLSGSALSNVASTGSITIPTMKRTGYPPHYAGAIEACASTGGILMPPVMGAVAFVMASLTTIPYSTIILAAVVPAILFFLGLFIQVDGYAARMELRGLPREECPSFGRTLRRGWHFLAVILFLVWGLVYMRWEEVTPFYASALLLLLVMLKSETRLDTIGKWLALLDGAGKLLVEMTALLLPIGLIVGGLVMTGTALAFTASLVSFADGNVLAALLFGAVAAFALGMAGMLTPAYIFLAVTLAPALIKFGLDPLGVHLFIIYCCTLSCITPPVAVASFLAAGIANADPMRTALQSMRLGMILFIVPFIFVFEPALLFQAQTSDVVWYITTALAGVWILTSGMEGYLAGYGKVSWLERLLLIIGGAGIVSLQWEAKAGGAVAVGALVVFWLIKQRMSRPTRLPTEF